MKQLPLGPNIREVCQKFPEEFVSFDRGGKPVYVCIFPLVHLDAKHERCRFFRIGLEIDPSTTTASSKPLTGATAISPLLVHSSEGA